jgi:hypothetical protein
MRSVTILRFTCRAVVGLVLIGLAGGRSVAQAPGGDPQAQGPQVLARGPIHEAFAAPLVFNASSGVVAPKPPPAAVEEQPPDQKPTGRDVEWIPGYWSWDDERNDYIWVSGIWRDLPPGRQWVPGYWNPQGNGFRWVSGFWAPSTASGQLDYLPPPPGTLEVGPNSPQPGENYAWAPGSWIWESNRYVWRPGYWVAAQPNWIWIPSSYVPTPSGYVYVDGYWDYPMDRRGLPFAPVAFAPGYVAGPAYVYTPSVTIAVGGLFANLFVRPSYAHYYYGDYYGPAALGPGSGYVSWISYQQTRVGYDPFYAHFAAVNGRDVSWERTYRQEYQYRVINVAARPPATYAAARSAGLMRPLHELAAAPEYRNRMVAVPPEHRAELVRRQAEVRELGQHRANQEFAERIPANVRPEQHAPRRIEIPRSPVAAAQTPRYQATELARPPAHPEQHAAFRPHYEAAPAVRRFEPPRAPQGREPARPHPEPGREEGRKPHEEPRAGRSGERPPHGGHGEVGRR